MTTVAEDMHTYNLLLKPIRDVVFDNEKSLGATAHNSEYNFRVSRLGASEIPEVIPPTNTAELCLEAFQPSQSLSQIGHEDRTDLLSFRSRFGCFGDTGSYP